MKAQQFTAVKLVWFVCNSCSKCFVERIPLKITVSIVSCFNTLHLYFIQGTKFAVKMKELLRNFWYYNVVKRSKNKEL